MTAFYAGNSSVGYARGHMPIPVSGDGPWGAAIAYWLARRQWRQADLLRAMREQDKTISKNTISRAARGLDVSTRVLRSIATVLNAPLELVLVSPERFRTDEQERRKLIDTVDEVLRQMKQPEAQSDPAGMLAAFQTLEDHVVAQEARTPKAPAVIQKLRKKSRRKH
jgi:transcriptional regulator with XRE-family HTH domain